MLAEYVLKRLNLNLVLRPAELENYGEKKGALHFCLLEVWLTYLYLFVGKILKLFINKLFKTLHLCKMVSALVLTSDMAEKTKSVLAHLFLAAIESKLWI